MKVLMSVTALSLALAAGAALAQTAPAPGKDASPAQLQREHNRAVKAGDTANDPMNSASSDALNQQQLQGTPLGSGASDAGGPTTAPPATSDATTPPAPDTTATPAQPGTTDSGTATTPDTGDMSSSSSSDSSSSSASPM